MDEGKATKLAEQRRRDAKARIIKACDERISNSPVPGLFFILPEVGLLAAASKKPGVYLKSGGLGRGLRAPSILLSKHKVLEYCDHLDKLTGVQGAGIPHTYRELVELWYEALGDVLDSVIAEATERVAQYRELHAALTGERWTPR